MLARHIAYFIIFIFLFSLWVYYNALSRTKLPVTIPCYQNISRYVIPEKNTSLILPKSRCNRGVFIAVVVCSAVANFKSRDAIRKTWGRHADVEVYFLLGKSGDLDFNAAVVSESEKHSDIIQEDFLDTYNNLTIKSIMLLKWVNLNCGHAKYVMKTDDDMFVHIPNLVHFLKVNQKSSLLLGCLINDSIPDRNPSSKYYVPGNMFPGAHYYPPYLSGTGYVLSGDAVPRLYRASLEMAFFYLEDVFITGMCASKIGLHLQHDSRFLYQNDVRKKDCCTLQSLITAHKLPPEELLRTWQTCFQSTACSSNAILNTNFTLIIISTILLLLIM